MLLSFEGVCRDVRVNYLTVVFVRRFLLDTDGLALLYSLT